MYHKGKDTMKVNPRTWIQIETFSYICWLAHDNERAGPWCTKPRSYALIEFTQPANCFCCFSGLIVLKEMACTLLRRFADYFFILALLFSCINKKNAKENLCFFLRYLLYENGFMLSFLQFVTLDVCQICVVDMKVILYRIMDTYGLFCM